MIHIEWCDDWEPDTSWMNDAQLAEFRRGDAKLMVCQVYDGENLVASLGNIHMPKDWFNDPYRSLVEDELMQEVQSHE